MGHFDLKKTAEAEIKLDMTPMIDVVFQLMIFFMCTLKFKTLEGKLSAFLPKDVGVNSSHAEPIEKVEIVLQVRNPGTKVRPYEAGQTPVAYGPSDKGRYEFGPDRVIEYSIANFTTRDLLALRERLQSIHTRRMALDLRDKVPSTIDARPGTCYSDVVRVLDQVMDAGFTDVTFVGAYPDGV